MGHNVDLQWLMGLPDYIRCKFCKELTKTNFDEYDIDCGEPEASNGEMMLDVQCAHCHENSVLSVKVSCNIIDEEAVTK